MTPRCSRAKNWPPEVDLIETWRVQTLENLPLTNRLSADFETVPDHSGFGLGGQSLEAIASCHLRSIRSISGVVA